MLTEWMDWAHFGLGFMVGGYLLWAKYMEEIDALVLKVMALEEFIETNAPKWGVDR